jgi:hypothetical protein
LPLPLPLPLTSPLPLPLTAREVGKEDQRHPELRDEIAVEAAADLLGQRGVPRPAPKSALLVLVLAARADPACA